MPGRWLVATLTGCLVMICARSYPQSTCEVARVAGGVDLVTVPATGDVVIVAQGLRVLRSVDGGFTFDEEPLGIAGSWPSVVADHERLLVAAGRWGDPNVVFLLNSDDGGVTFDPPLDVLVSSDTFLIDPELLVLSNGDLLIFVTEIVSDPETFVVHAFRSLDGGVTWQWLSDPVVGPAHLAIEDPKAHELPGGELLLAYEYEIQDLAASRIEQVRSVDGGLTWSAPSVIWDDVPGSDNEPGGYQRISADELWFLVSTDEDAVDTYTNAVVKRKVSSDGGITWHSKATLVGVPDQIVFGSAILPSGLVGLATVRFFTGGPRTLYLYAVDPNQAGPWFCGPLLFADGFESGGTDGWSLAIP